MGDKNKDNVTTSPSEETTQAKPEETKVEPQDIDFKKEKEELGKQSPKPKRTPQEEISYNLKKLAERAEEAGVDPIEILGGKKEKAEAIDTSNLVTKLDLARLEASKLAKSTDELDVIMWWVENKGLSVDDAHLMANKSKIKSAFQQLTGGVKAPVGAGESSGQKSKTNSSPELSRSEHNTLLSRGFKLVKPGLYQAKYNQHRYDENTRTWVSERISK